ncbi:hypothetical protein ACHAW6_005681 [Cyclotella cf. meneghiniana]
MLDSFEKESRLHERRLARQRQMRLMEEAASGLPLRDDDDRDDEADEMEYEMPPPNFVEDVDSEDDVPSMYSGTNNNNNNITSNAGDDDDNTNDNLWSSSTNKALDDSKLKFVMGDTATNHDETASYSSWTERQRREHDESRRLIMLASRRVSSSAGRGTLEMEFRDGEQRRRYNRCPVWVMLHRKFICSFCLIASLVVMGALIAQTRKNSYYDGADWPANPAAEGGSGGNGITGGSYAVDESMEHSTSESTHSPQDSTDSNNVDSNSNINNNDNSNGNNDNNETDAIKFERIKDRLLEHQISHASALEDPASPQYKALQWLVRDDPRQLDVPSVDDVEAGLTGEQVDDEEALFQRYALAVFWFQTTDAEIVNGGDGRGGPFRGDDEGEKELTLQEIRWRESTNWMTEKGFCLCGLRYDDDFYVAILNLTDNNIHGVVPREVYMAFTKMKALDISLNELGGSIRREIGALTDLQDLYLQSNQFTGAIPTTIGELVNLYNVNISDNNIGGTLPTQIGMLSKLRDASMFKNRIEGKIPVEIGYMTELLALYLDSNRLTGQIPTSIGQLTSLLDLRLRANKLTGTLPTELGVLTNLETLYLDTNSGITGKIPTELGNLAKATEIQLYQNNLTGPLPSELGLLNGLIFLYLGQFWVSTLSSPTLAFGFVELIVFLGSSFAMLPPNINDNFSPDSNELTGSIPEEWGGMRNLEQLFLSGNNLRGKIPETIRGMEALQYFRASDNQFSGTIPTDMGKMLKMEFLYMEENDFDGVIPSELGELHKLQLLHLDGNNFSGQMPSEICRLKTNFFLVHLSAANNDEGFSCACCTNQ